MKSAISIFTLYFIACLPVCAQEDNGKYAIGLKGGGMWTLAQKGPRTPTPIAEKMHFVYPLASSVGLHFDLRIRPRHYIGLEFMRDEFDYGYDAPRSFYRAGVGITSGDMAANDYVYLYKAGFRWVYELVRRKRWMLHTMVVPSIGYYAHVPGLNDTAASNGFWYSIDNKEVQYISHPPYQRAGFYPLLKGGVELAYRFSPHLSASLDVCYQQGFKKFVIDSVNVVRPGDPDGIYKEQLFWTKVNGTSAQFHFGLRYDFGRK